MLFLYSDLLVCLGETEKSSLAQVQLRNLLWMVLQQGLNKPFLSNNKQLKLTNGLLSAWITAVVAIVVAIISIVSIIISIVPFYTYIWFCFFWHWPCKASTSQQDQEEKCKEWLNHFTSAVKGTCCVQRFASSSSWRILTLNPFL